MSDQFALRGSWDVTPIISGASSGFPTIIAPLNELKTLTFKSLDDINLTDDAAFVVPLGSVTNAFVVVIKPDRKVVARFTSADGTLQAIPIDGFFSLINSSSNPITALTLQRTAGQTTIAKVLLGGN